MNKITYKGIDFVSKAVVKVFVEQLLAYICLTCGLTNSKVLFSSRFYRGPEILSEVNLRNTLQKNGFKMLQNTL